MDGAHRFSAAACLCLVLLASVSAVNVAPWIPASDAAEWVARRSAAALSNDPNAGTSDAALGRIPAAVSESLQRLFTEVVAMNVSKSARNGARNGAYESACLDEFALLMLIPGDNLFGASKGIEAIDALGKPGPNVLYGNVQMLGGFDECLDIGEEFVKFWAAPINVSIVTTLPPTTLLPLQVGMCVPRPCNSEDFQYFLNESNDFLHETLQLNTFSLIGEYDQIAVTTSRTVPLTTGAIIMIIVCSVFLLLAAVGSLADVGVKGWRNLSSKLKLSSISHNSEFHSERAPLLGQPRLSSHHPLAPRGDIFSRLETPLEFLTAFSIFKNVEIILSTKQPPSAITSLNGIRVISMFWVILGHTFLWCLSVTSNPLYIFFRVAPRFSAQVITSGFFSVDSFFFLSGALVAYLTLREMERKRGWFPVITYYLHRYLRLTMVYAFLLFFWWNLTVHLGSGPTWQSSMGVGSFNYEACSKYWWTNLLYINNFYPWKLGDECMGWTWYLANDMQFFIVAPVVLIPLYHFFPVGLLISGVMLSVTFAANGAIAGTQHFLANTLLPGTERESDDIYVKPYCRAAPYIVGLVLGFILFKKVQVKVHWLLNLMVYSIMWVIAAGCCFSVVYGLYNSFHGHTLTEAQNVAYLMFGRCAWAVGLALIVFACHNGYGWVVNDFLSMKFWIPLSRLTYTAYLVHPIILTVAINTNRGTVGYTDNFIAVYAVAMVVLSFGAAGVVAVFVEFPLSNLEMAVFKAIGLKPRESVRQVGTTQDHMPETGEK